MQVGELPTKPGSSNEFKGRVNFEPHAPLQLLPSCSNHSRFIAVLDSAMRVRHVALASADGAALQERYTTVCKGDVVAAKYAPYLSPGF
jgi:hypothetical protein